MSESAYLVSQEKEQRRYARVALRWLYHHFPGGLQKAVAASLAYEWSERSIDAWYIKGLKRIINIILFYSPLHLLRFAQRYYSDSPYYPFEDEIILTTTRVIFTRSKRSSKRICLKLWQRTDKEVSDNQLIVRSDKYLLEGFEFNKTFAPGVYLGIASVIIHDDKKIQRGSLIKNPCEGQLPSGKDGQRNALVMKRLRDRDRLDQQLKTGNVDVAFLAREVARMHRLMQISSAEDVPDDYGTPAQIASKLVLNLRFFDEAVNRLYHNGRERYKSICGDLEKACEIFASLFAARYQEGRIKHCHGDLKVTNLWARRRRLLALDCIDFNPALCNIDTLSDVAMLAVDLERFALPEPSSRRETFDLEQFKAPILPEQKPIYTFLLTYLNEMQEDVAGAEPLLEYYMTEKAIVCMYVSILFDTHNFDLGEQYLHIACRHAQRLKECIRRVQISTAPLDAQLIPTGTIQDGLASTALHSGFQ